MLRHLDKNEVADRVMNAVRKTLTDGITTGDLASIIAIDAELELCATRGRHSPDADRGPRAAVSMIIARGALGRTCRP